MNYPIFQFELKPLSNLCHLCHLWHKWQRHIFTLAYEQKFALATFKQHLVSKHGVVCLLRFPCIDMCLCHLCHKWHKWHKFDNDFNSVEDSEMLRKLEYGVIHVQCNLDYPDSLGPNKTVRISYSPDKRGRFIHSGIGMGLVIMFG